MAIVMFRLGRMNIQNDELYAVKNAEIKRKIDKQTKYINHNKEKIFKTIGQKNRKNKKSKKKKQKQIKKEKHDVKEFTYAFDETSPIPFKSQMLKTREIKFRNNKAKLFSKRTKTQDQKMYYETQANYRDKKPNLIISNVGDQKDKEKFDYKKAEEKFRVDYFGRTSLIDSFYSNDNNYGVRKSRILSKTMPNIKGQKARDLKNIQLKIHEINDAKKNVIYFSINFRNNFY